jgi:hypothetical protein
MLTRLQESRARFHAIRRLRTECPPEPQS